MIRGMMEDPNSAVPVTELSNLLSKDIDISSPQDIVSILRQCDDEIFDGWLGSKGLNEEAVLMTIERISTKIADVIKDPSTGLVCISGCGTSGRLAYIVSHTFNKHLMSLGRQPCFRYIMAGDDKALFTSQELAEDDPHTGDRVLDQVTAGKSKVVYIGVSCGLSASFVAGQLDHCMSHLDKFTPVVLGFNPCHLARELPIPNWNKTFLSVMTDLLTVEKDSQSFILNPIIGPDPITGSSRMKSGTATRILLEVLALSAIHGYDRKHISHLLSSYRETCDSVYRYEEQLGKLIEIAGHSLRSNRHIYYLGCEGKALMSMVDASECPPTYGAALDDVRGFIFEGYNALQNNDGDLSALGEEYRISIQHFEAKILPFVEEDDLVVLIGEDVCHKVERSTLKAKCKKVLISFEHQDSSILQCEDFHLILDVSLNVPTLQSVTPDSARCLMAQLLQEMAVKWILNSLSTGAHILKGKVCGNHMVDVRTSNTKLYLRAIGIIQQFSGCSRKEAEESLLKSIYEKEEIDSHTWSLSIVEHIKVAADRDKIVPTAILIASQGCSLKVAKEKVEKEPIIRKLFLNI